MFKKRYLVIPGLFIIAVAFGVFFFADSASQKNETKTQVPIVNAIAEKQITSSTSSMDSPDGKETLTLKKSVSSDMTTFAFYTNEGLVFTKTLNSGSSILIPFNTWSPDDKYVFLKEDLRGVTNYYVIPSQINVTDLFNEKITNYKLTDITGWASPTLLVLNTNNLDGTPGPSYWFDIPSKSFIILSTRFN